MVSTALSDGQRKASSTAKRLRKNDDTTAYPGDKTTVVCDQCGERFAIGHPAAFPDLELEKKQATWLEDQLVWDHIQENKHRGSIRLPGSGEMK